MESAKEQFLKVWEKEYQTTMKVLKSFPENRQDYKPHEISKSAKELAWTIAGEERTMFVGAANGNFDWSTMVKAPETMKEVLSTYEHIHKESVQIVKNTSDESLKEDMKFYIAAKTMGDFKKMDLLWMFLMDQIHHRGQFSVYLRLVGAKVPSIYGPTADEKWD